MVDACKGLSGLLFGHNFHTQVVHGPIDLSRVVKVELGSNADALRPVHAVVTLCTRCGVAPPAAPKEKP